MDTDTLQKLERLGKLFSLGHYKDLIPLMVLLSIKGKVYNLKEHFQFEPLFKLKRPKRLTLKCARQVGKSQNICGRNLLLSWAIPFYRELFVLPRFEQAKRLSNGVMKEFVDTSPFKDSFFDTKICDNSVMERSFLNNSRQYFSFAFLDADRVRGISSVSDLTYDESQDICWDFVQVIDEVTSAVTDFGFISFTGTPKSLDNTLSVLWNDSSQAEWHIKCGCGKENIPSAKYDLLQMIGANTCVCAKCGKPLECEQGFYVHHQPSLISSFAGYHISQVIHPLHYKYPSKWRELLYKQRKNSKSKFFNEVLGEACDSADKLISEPDLQKISNLDENTIKKALEAKKRYSVTAVGIDWGGGGEDSGSYTAICFGGLPNGQDTIEIPFMTKLSRNLTPTQESKYILELLAILRPNFIAHDYGGAGALRETLMLQGGVPYEKIVPFTYVTSSNKAVIHYNAPDNGYRHSYSLDKTRSIVILCAMMRAEKIRFPKFDTSARMDLDGADTSLSLDFTHINEDRQERPRGSDVVLIAKTPKASDDMVHAVNYLCSAIWHSQQNYPNLAVAEQIRLSAEDVANLNPINPDWDN